MKTLEQVIEETEWLDKVSDLFGDTVINEAAFLKLKNQGLTPEEAVKIKKG